MNAMEKAAKGINRTTGRVYTFIVETANARGADSEKMTVEVVALDTADAWGLVGDIVGRFMRGPSGRKVNSIHITS